MGTYDTDTLEEKDVSLKELTIFLDELPPNSLDVRRHAGRHSILQSALDL